MPVYPVFAGAGYVWLDIYSIDAHLVLSTDDVHEGLGFRKAPGLMREQPSAGRSAEQGLRNATTPSFGAVARLCRCIAKLGSIPAYLINATVPVSERLSGGGAQRVTCPLAA
jgi:hypothetical protein